MSPPSTPLSLKETNPITGNILRRRSGAYVPPNPTDKIGSHNLTWKNRTRKEQLLPSPPLPPLPFDAQFTSTIELTSTLDAQFSPIPLTPRPKFSNCGSSESSLKSVQTCASQISRLPTPDFTDPKYGNKQCRPPSTAPSSSSQSMVSHGMSFIRFPPISDSLASLSYSGGPSYAPGHSRPESLRTQSDATLCSVKSTNSVDSGHKSLIPSIGTTDKFTHKWPKPQSWKTLDTKSRTPVSFSAAKKAALLALEDGQGLGMDSVGRWNSFKWTLLFSVFTVLVYGTAALVCALSTWFRGAYVNHWLLSMTDIPLAWGHADVMYVADQDILILITLAAIILVFTSLLGITGALLNSRPILAIYNLLLWPAFMSMLAVGYTSYKRSNLSLDHKLNFAWSQYYTSFGRLLIQNSLQCCGYNNALHEATFSSRCYPRSPLPGCKEIFYRFEKENLSTVWAATFGVVPLHLINIVVALLCSNHVTKTFGKGITPKQYRLSGADVKADADRISKRMNLPLRPEICRASSSGIFREDRTLLNYNQHV